jgi:hypothetical protein
MMADVFQDLAGPGNFSRRIELFEDYWSEWHKLSSCMWLDACRSGSGGGGRGGSGGGGAERGERGCRCEHISFDSYCRAFDELSPQRERERERLVLTRQMLHVLCSCNQLFGFDGFTYDPLGQRVGEEFIAVNQPIPAPVSDQSPSIATVFLSQIDRFALV